MKLVPCFLQVQQSSPLMQTCLSGKVSNPIIEHKISITLCKVIKFCDNNMI